MAFLIQPIRVGDSVGDPPGGELECLKHGKTAGASFIGRPYRTVAKRKSISSLVGLEDDDYWDLIPFDTLGELEQGAIEFATSCGITSITAEAEFDRDPADDDALADGSLEKFGVRVYLNGVEQVSITTTLLAGGTKVEQTYSCTPGPCGNLWRFESSVALKERTGTGKNTRCRIKIIELNKI